MWMAAFALVAAVIVPDKPDLKSIADRVHGTVVQVRGQAGEAASYSTGILVGPRLALTTLHAVAAAAGGDAVAPLPRIEVMLPDQGVALARLVSADTHLDLALLKLADDAPLLPPVAFAEEDPTQGETLIAMGVGEDQITAIDVTVSDSRGSVFAVASSHPIDSRFWGGPLFDLQGRFAAVELTALGEPHALPARFVREWLQRAFARQARLGPGQRLISISRLSSSSTG
jgi:S1-C subfamily serine protease